MDVLTKIEYDFTIVYYIKAAGNMFKKANLRLYLYGELEVKHNCKIGR